MKTIIKKITFKKVIILLIITTIAYMFINQHIKYKTAIAKAKEEIEQVRNEKSEIELQKEELLNLEEEWRTAQKYCESKPEIEDKIHNLRNEILGL